MIRAFNVRIYPNKTQQTQIRKTIGCSRFIYNLMLIERMEVYERFIDDKDGLKKHTYKTENQYKVEFPFLKEADSIALQASREHLFKAYQNFFNGLKKGRKVGFPKFKSKKGKETYRTKFSVYLQHLLLTDSSTHRTYDSHIDLEDQKILVKIINDLIQNDGSGPNKEITANDVEKAFLDNFGDPNKVKFYLNNYWEWQTSNFQKNLKDFNDRRNMIKNGEYEEFIKTKFNDAYRRFFNDAMGILNSLTELSDFKGYRLSRVFSIADIDYLKRVFSI